MTKKDWGQVRLLALDFDGVMTDGKVIVGTDTIESVLCSHADGQGIDLVLKTGLPVVVISGQKSAYVDPRCKKMKVPFFKAVKDKPACLREYLAQEHPGVSLDQVCFVGDDRSDREVMKIVGFPVAVANATTEIKALAIHITNRQGGDGAVREICDLLCDSRDQSLETKPKVLITGTGEKAITSVCSAANNLAFELACLGYPILTNGGLNGVPESAAKGVERAIKGRGVGSSTAYTYLPGLTAGICGTTDIRRFFSFELRNGAICHDADIAVFFQGGLGTTAKLFAFIHRLVHINGLLEKKHALDAVRRKKIILHDSFAKPEECQNLFGSIFGDSHRQVLSFASSVEEIVDLVKTH